MKLSTIANPAFDVVFNKLMGAKLNGKVAFRLAKVAQKIRGDKDIYEKLRVEACEEAADKDEAGKPLMIGTNYKIPNDKVEECNNEIIAIYEKFADKDEAGKPIMTGNNFKIPASKMADLNTKLQEMLKVEVEVEKFSLDDLEAAALTASDMMLITEMIEE